MEVIMKYFDSKSAEEKWSRYWQEQGIYKYDENSTAEVFSVDTPPPTVSGSLHIGHVFSYTHTDILCRFQRMTGKNVFYPIGWDDNGLPTERRVQNYYHIQCDPGISYDPWLDFEEADRKTKKGRARKISRKNFIEHCHKLTALDEEVFKSLWKRNGLSVEWEREYSTIGNDSMKTAQLSFIDLHKKGHLYNQAAPVTWDIDFETAVAQAEIEDREEKSFYHFINFKIENGETVTIATTRPELLPACVAMTAHPSDKRYRHLFGKNAITPLFDVPIPIFPSEEADPEKGTGILMVCTFGDAMDVEWWKREKLPLRQIIGKNGRISSIEFGKDNWPSLNPETANHHMAGLSGKTVKSARTEIVELLKENKSGLNFIERESQETTHPVRYYEKGKRPLEILSSRQWFMSIMDKKEELLRKGEELNWYPDHMRKRYSDWTENLKFDWCISRQRFFGVPIPAWYPLDENGQANLSKPILPDPQDLPIDPSSDCPRGFLETHRDQPEGFTAEKDIFDTWFTSSMTPQICSGWGKIPMTIRPQSHEIIRTWTFYTIIKSMLHENSLPWKNVLISGWILDKERKKMSKSKGNVVTPESWFDQYGADSIRYWSAGARLGTDTAFDEKILKTGRKLVTKIFNASKFVFSFDLPENGELMELDLSFLSSLHNMIVTATENFHQFNFSRALDDIESFFWNNFTDSYLELVKTRAKESDYSAVYTLRVTLNILLRAFAPFLPFITEEMWDMGFAQESGFSSIHKAPWPGKKDVPDLTDKDSKIFELAARCLSDVHRKKSEAGVSLNTQISVAELGLDKESLAIFHHVEKDLKQAGWIKEIYISETSGTSDSFLKAVF
jgi:valyl-tRNA synthetase